MTKPAAIRTIDKVKTTAQLRLDRPDFDAIMDLVEEHSQKQMGALMGNAKGVVSPPKMTFANILLEWFCAFGPFQYYLSTQYWDEDATYKGWKGGFLTFDPTEGNNISYVDYTTYRGSGDPFYVYVQPVATDMDTDARRRWQSGANAAISMKTRSRIRHTFKTELATKDPDHADNVGWAPVAYVTDADTTPVVQYLSMFDGPQPATNTGDAGSGWLYANTGASGILGSLADGTDITGGSGTPIFHALGVSRGLGVVQLLQLMRSRMARMLDVDRTLPWLSPPMRTAGEIGIKQLADMAYANNAQLFAQRDLPFIAFAGRFDYDAGAYTLGTYALSPGAGVPSTGGFGMVITANTPPVLTVACTYPNNYLYNLVSVQITPIGTSSADSWVSTADETTVGCNLTATVTGSHSFYLTITLARTW